MRKALLCIIAACLSMGLLAEPLTFSGGYTQVVRSASGQRIVLGEGAAVDSGNLTLSAQAIELYGEDYSMVKATGSVSVYEKDRQISLQCPSVFYDRTSGLLTADGWIEIQDTRNEAVLSGAYMEFNVTSGLLLLQMQASMHKATSKGLLKCEAQSISYDSEKRTLVLSGSAVLEWDKDIYQASMIRIDIDKEEIQMDGWVTGTVNG